MIFGPCLRSLVLKRNRKKDPRNSSSDIQDDEEDDTQSLAKDDEVLVQQWHLLMDPLLLVLVNPGKLVPFGTPSGGDRGELAREKDLVPSSMGGLKSQMDQAAKNTEVSSNSNSDKGNCPILSDLVNLNSDSNLKLRNNLYNSHEFKHCDKAENYVIEIAELSSTNKSPHISCSSLEKEARNFEIPLEKLPDIYKYIEMESLSDVAAEIPEPKTTSLRSWKWIIRDKSNLNPKDSSTSMLVPAKRLVGAFDPITDPDISHKQKKLSVENDTFQLSTPTTRVGTQPLFNP